MNLGNFFLEAVDDWSTGLTLTIAKNPFVFCCVLITRTSFSEFFVSGIS